jgi:hypothetical protein
MKINRTLRKELIPLLPKEYRKIIVNRLRAKGKKVHPNTVSNALLRGTENDTVVNEILLLANEEKENKNQLHEELSKNLKQLSAA